MGSPAVARRRVATRVGISLRPPEAPADRAASGRLRLGLDLGAQRLGHVHMSAGGPPARIRSTVSRSSRTSEGNGAHDSSSTPCHRPRDPKVGSRSLPARLVSPGPWWRRARSPGGRGPWRAWTQPGRPSPPQASGPSPSDQTDIGAEAEQPLLHCAGQIGRHHYRFERLTGRIAVSTSSTFTTRTFFFTVVLRLGRVSRRTTQPGPLGAGPWQPSLSRAHHPARLGPALGVGPEGTIQVTH